MPIRLAEKYLLVVANPRRASKKCSFASFPLPQPILSPSSRAFNTCRPNQDEHIAEQSEPERWRETPPRMTAPFRSRPLIFGNYFRINKDPERLNQFYVDMLGENGDRMLTDEVKWLAVTHKSFDHGRRGYNERLGFLGSI